MPRKPPLSSNRINDILIAVTYFRNRMPAPYSRYRRGNIKYLVNIRSSRYKNYND
jgi:hypothetical protein